MSEYHVSPPREQPTKRPLDGLYVRRINNAIGGPKQQNTRLVDIEDY